MTLHEVVTSLFWFVAGGYVLYLGWFAVTGIRRRDVESRRRRRRLSSGR